MLGFPLAQAIIALKADSSAFEAQLNSAGYLWDQWAEKLSLGIGPISGALKLAGAGALGLTAALAGTVKVAVGLEAQLTSLRRVSGLTGGEMGKLSENLKNIARNTAGISLSELNSLVEFGARLGVGEGSGDRAAALTRLAEAMSKMKAIISDMDVTEATTQMMRTLKVFHQNEDSALGFASALAAVDQASTASAPELLQMVNRLSGVGVTLKATIPQLIGLAAAMRDAGVEVDSGSTAVSQLMMRMAQHTKKFADAIGVDFRKLAATIAQDPVAAVELFLSKLKSFNSSEQTQILGSLHMQGRMSGQILLQLAQNMGAVGNFVEMANREWKSQAAILEGYNIAASSTSAQLSLLVNRLHLIGAEVGRATLPLFRGLVSVLNELTNQVLTMVQRTVPAWEEWAKSVEDRMQVLKTLFTGSGEWVTVAMASIADIADSLGGMFDALAEAILSVMKQLASATAQLLSNAFTIAFSSMRAEAEESLEYMGIVASQWGQNIKKAILGDGGFLGIKADGGVWGWIRKKGEDMADWAAGRKPAERWKQTEEEEAAGMGMSVENWRRMKALNARRDARARGGMPGLLDGVTLPGGIDLGGVTKKFRDAQAGRADAWGKLGFLGEWNDAMQGGAGGLAGLPGLLGALADRADPAALLRGARGLLGGADRDRNPRRTIRMAQARRRREREAKRAEAVDRYRRTKQPNLASRVKYAAGKFGAGAAGLGEMQMADVAGQAGKQVGLAEFARSLQESVFGKDKEDAQKQLVEETRKAAEVGEKQVEALATNNELLRDLTSKGLTTKFA